MPQIKKMFHVKHCETETGVKMGNIPNNETYFETMETLQQILLNNGIHEKISYYSKLNFNMFVVVTENGKTFHIN